MWRRVAFAFALVLLPGLVWLGVRLDAAPKLDQAQLWLGFAIASLGGAALGFALLAPQARGRAGRLLLFACAALLVWRLAYFPIMVFSGHVASFGEWLPALLGLPIAVYPVFLASVALLHASAVAFGLLALAQSGWRLRAAAALAFFLAACVSISGPRDLHPLPDRHFAEAGPAPPPRAAACNPYAPALWAPGYLPHQRVVLLAAALTYETIPPSPWATTVKAVLEGLFEEKPFGDASDRVLEHYLAYRSAHPRLACEGREPCAAAPPAPSTPPVCGPPAAATPALSTPQAADSESPATPASPVLAPSPVVSADWESPTTSAPSVPPSAADSKSPAASAFAPPVAPASAPAAATATVSAPLASAAPALSAPQVGDSDSSVVSAPSAKPDAP